METPGLNETNFNTQCYNDAVGLTSRWKVRFRLGAELDLRPLRPEKLHMFFGNIIIVIGTNLIFVFFD